MSTPRPPQRGGTNDPDDSNEGEVIGGADPAVGRLYREEFVRRWGEATAPDVSCEE